MTVVNLLLIIFKCQRSGEGSLQEPIFENYCLKNVSFKCKNCDQVNIFKIIETMTDNTILLLSNIKQSNTRTQIHSIKSWVAIALAVL